MNLLRQGQQAGQPLVQQDQKQEEPMAFCWSSIIWTRALLHNNPQVGAMPA
jgi:hypothetical protein